MKVLITIVFVLLFTCSSRSQDFAALETVAIAEMKEKNAVGATVALIKDNKVIYSKAFGVANVETNTPMTNQTLFQTVRLPKALPPRSF